ncbi:hypothetical protein NLI96_g4428 [Meripilus lineatus]|uniref:Uncharacterized protein n=1 Tax=Meripilus lineatus TaxID=2056292 RepID=A0AAD5V4N0_9APHY|nr:hypothetical protein NLI96_g4428 [Physisporinus lineatus]
MATLTESLPSHLDIQHNNQDPLQEQPQDKISAYYSLVFPNFTYYIQTLNVIIGRRCVPNAAASSSDNPQVDVDLGSLKSVSRLHAKIEYEEDEERFVLHVMGRNGAWVDGVWSGSGSKVPLGDRFVPYLLPPTHLHLKSALQRIPLPQVLTPPPEIAHVLPHVDITSLSPPSSIPSCSPPPATITPALPKIPPEPTLPNSNSISRPKPNPKKRKKSDVDSRPLPKPDVIPPKPQLTYAQLCYRAIKGLHGKASLQEICQWIQENHQYYKYCEKDWESSVRHNLSSNRAFKKAERGPDERGKGALWTVDPQHEHTFEEQEAKRQNLAAFGTTGGKDGKALSKKGKGTPSLNVSLSSRIHHDRKGAPLPPPLTSAPLIPKAKAALNSSTITNLSSSSTPTPIKRESNTLHAPLFTSKPSGAPTPTLGAVSHIASVSGSASASTSTPTPASALTTSTPAPAPSAFPAIPASVRLPIIVGPTPGSSSSASDPATPPKPIVLHENTLVLNPEIFSHLTPQHLKDLEVLGAQKALEILQSYIGTGERE